jgi:hypothetical protein
VAVHETGDRETQRPLRRLRLLRLDRNEQRQKQRN